MAAAQPRARVSFSALNKSGYASQDITFQTLADDFLKTLRVKFQGSGMTEKRYRKYAVAIEHFLNFSEVKPNMLVAEIKNQHILDFKHTMMGNDFENSTIADWLQCLKSVFLFGQWNELTKTKPIHWLQDWTKDKDCMISHRSIIGISMGKWLFC